MQAKHFDYVLLSTKLSERRPATAKKSRVKFTGNVKGKRCSVCRCMWAIHFSSNFRHRQKTAQFLSSFAYFGSGAQCLSFGFASPRTFASTCVLLTCFIPMTTAAGVLLTTVVVDHRDVFVCNV